MSKASIIGITGGIGSGKSMVSRILASTGIPVYNSDAEAKKLYDHYPELLDEVVKRFGKEILLPSGKLNKQALASIVFNDDKALQDLNKMVHPRVREHFHGWMNKYPNEKYLIKEAAVLIESGAYKDCDAIWLVIAPEDLRIQRVMNRDLISRELVRERMSKQWTDKKKKEYASVIIRNDEKHLLIPQVIDSFEQLFSSSTE